MQSNRRCRISVLHATLGTINTVKKAEQMLMRVKVACRVPHYQIGQSYCDCVPSLACLACEIDPPRMRILPISPTFTHAHRSRIKAIHWPRARQRKIGSCRR